MSIKNFPLLDAFLSKMDGLISNVRRHLAAKRLEKFNKDLCRTIDHDWKYAPKSPFRIGFRSCNRCLKCEIDIADTGEYFDVRPRNR